MNKSKQLYQSPELYEIRLLEQDVLFASENRNDGTGVGDGDTIGDTWIW